MFAQAPNVVTAQLSAQTRNTITAGPIVPLCYCLENNYCNEPNNAGSVVEEAIVEEAADEEVDEEPAADDDTDPRPPPPLPPLTSPS